MIIIKVKHIFLSIHPYPWHWLNWKIFWKTWRCSTYFPSFLLPATTQRPEHWVDMPNDASVHLFDLPPQSDEYKHIHQLFTRTSKTTVTQIKRIQNPALYLRYKAFKQTLDFDPNCKNKSNEMLLWHGSDTESVRKIYTNGFNRGFADRNGECIVTYTEGSCFEERKIFEPG